MKYRDKKTGEIIEAHPSLDLTGYYIIDCDGAFCMIPQETFFEIYKLVEDVKENTVTLDVPNKKDLIANLNLNMDEYMKLLDKAKKKAHELQGIINKLKNAKVEAISSDSKHVNITVNCNCNADMEKTREYIANKIEEALKGV